MLSVVIPAYNEEENIGKCLEALIKQDTTEPFEVIVVDNHSTDRTSDIAKVFSDRLDLTVVFEGRRLRGAARAAGCAVAKGEIIFCTDADAEVPSCWLSILSEAIRKEGIVAAGSNAEIHDCDIATNVICNASGLTAMYLSRVFLGYFWISGFSMAFRSDAYRKVGGFDPRSDAGEDLDLLFRLRKIGRVTFRRNAAVTASGRRFRRGVIIAWWAYFRTFFEKFILRRRTVRLSNPGTNDPSMDAR